jgi:hypothetical protein
MELTNEHLNAKFERFKTLCAEHNNIEIFEKRLTGQTLAKKMSKRPYLHNALLTHQINVSGINCPRIVNKYIPKDGEYAEYYFNSKGQLMYKITVYGKNDKNGKSENYKQFYLYNGNESAKFLYANGELSTIQICELSEKKLLSTQVATINKNRVKSIEYGEICTYENDRLTSAVQYKDFDGNFLPLQESKMFSPNFKPVFVNPFVEELKFIYDENGNLTAYTRQQLPEGKINGAFPVKASFAKLFKRIEQNGFELKYLLW